MEIKKLFEDEGNSPIIITPTIHYDDRGYFYESFNEKDFRDKVCNTTFVQDNQSKSSYGVLRGLHFQKPPYAQAKLVRVVKGAVYDVAVNLIKGSKHYGQYFGVLLTENNHKQFFIPRGYAHGFLALANDNIFQYKCDNAYNYESEGGVQWNDKDIDIPWDTMISGDQIILSAKDVSRTKISEFNTPF